MFLNNNVKIGTSLSTAYTLGLRNIRIDVECKTAYLLIGSSCERACDFCGMSKKEEKSLSRIKWPLFDLKEVVESLKLKVQEKKIERVCLQVTCSDNGALLKDLIYQIKEMNVPLSLSKSVESLVEIEAYLELGVDKVTVNLDLVQERDYLSYKGISYVEKKELLIAAAKKFSNKIVCHIIIGFSESEQECVELFNALINHRITVALFAFFPIKGTKLENHPQPEMGKYRRLQLVKYLLEQKKMVFEKIKFDKFGKINSISEVFDVMDRNLSKAFQTTGCQGCTRPYYTERPSAPLYNFPYALSCQEIEVCIKESGL
ncbi:MAG: hypothetical protein NTX05_00205 [Fusobacteria bacterium]|nr:hypothetical protein [Fusobacteriota bacterium]